MKDIKKSPPPSADKRRYDSLAVLIQGDGVCGASCFDGENLILANNSGVETELTNRIIDYLKTVAIMGSGKIDQKNTLKGQLMSFAHANINLIKTNKKYEARFQAALDKVTHSLRCAYQNPSDPSAFSLDMAEAIRNGKIIFLTNTTATAKKRSLHAEMQIVDYLYFHPRKLLNSQCQLYLGISKKCCLNCELAIQSVNLVKKAQIVEVRDKGHGFCFAAGIPLFLKSDTKIKADFLQRRGAEKLEDVFSNGDKGRIPGDNQLHTPSSSVYESSSAQEDHSEISISLDDEIKDKPVRPLTVSAQPIIKKLEPLIKPIQKPKNQGAKKKKNNKKKIKELTYSVSSPAVFFSKNNNSTKKSSSLRKKHSAPSPIAPNFNY